MNLTYHCCCYHLAQSALSVQIGGVSWQQQLENEGPLQTRLRMRFMYIATSCGRKGSAQIYLRSTNGQVVTRSIFAYGILTENLRCAYGTGTT